MENKEIIKSIFFDEIVKEAQNGEVKVLLKDNHEQEEFIFNVGFYTKETFSIDSFKPTLIIDNKEKFVDLLYEYIKLCDSYNNFFKKYDMEGRIKGYLTVMWSNATYEDFANPCLFVQKLINFYKNKLCSSEITVYNQNIDSLNNSDILIKDVKQDIRMETPYAFTPILKDKDDEYELPTISYGIEKKNCYIYAVQNKQKEINSSYQKKIKRILYKLNGGVLDLETDEYLAYKNGDDYYPENISDVSPASLLSLSIFFDVLKQTGIDKIKVVTVLPIRAEARTKAFKKRYQYKKKYSNLSDKELTKLLLEYERDNLRTSQNLSDKLIRNFRRIEEQTGNCQITSFPMELDEYLHVDVKDYRYGSNEILDDVIKKDYNISK